MCLSSVVLLIGLFFSSVQSFGDFVDTVECTADGIVITLKKQLPVPKGGMWDLEVEGFPKCPGVTKTDVGGGHRFSIHYSDQDWCGVKATSILTPAWVTFAKVVLVLKDGNGTTVADSVSCIYDTRFDTSLLTFRGDITGQNHLYGGSLREDGADVETTVYSSEAVSMDFYDQIGRPMHRHRVKLGDSILFKIFVSNNDQVARVMPENCYFSSSSIPEEDLLGGRTLSFVRNSCFNSRNGMVRTFLSKMQRSLNGSTYEMNFPAFHFSGFGENLYVHCTILACLDTQNLCQPQQDCFDTNRRKRSASFSPVKSIGNYDKRKTEELMVTKYIIVEDEQQQQQQQQREIFNDELCMRTDYFSALFGSLILAIIFLMVICSCLFGRLFGMDKKDKQVDSQIFWPESHQFFVKDQKHVPSVTLF